MKRENIYRRLLYVFFVALMLFYGVNMSEAATTVAEPAKAANTAVNTAGQAISVSPLDVVKNPNKFLNKEIEFNAEFVSFSSLGLDYKPALRESAKYISVLIKRPDVLNHVIPLSEMKIFLSRDIAEKNVDVEAGDKIKITGKVFATALGDPWVEAKTFTILNTKTKDKKVKNK